MDNKQLGNVGNEGDILKHQALIRIIEEMQAVHSGPILYVDTHSFLAISPISKKNEAIATNAVESNDLPKYSSLERPYLAQGKYLCSPGIALSLFKSNASFYFCEANPETSACPRRRIVARSLLCYLA